MAMSESPAPERWTLSDLPFAARLALAAFLVSVGLGYLSALVNLHFQEATPGNPLPDEADVIRAYHGGKVSQFERLIVAHPSLPFTGSGSMRRVFTEQRQRFGESVKNKKAEHMKLDPKDPKNVPLIKEAYYKDLEGERVALVEWIRAGASKDAYEKDGFKLEGKLKDLPITPAFVQVDDKGNRTALIKDIIDKRCASCHTISSEDKSGQFPLETWGDISVYLAPEGKGKSLAKLALTTHVHLLSFSMLYGLTGLILALSSMPAIIRVPLAPLALVAQVVDISFWWLARMDDPYGPMFARGIMVTGGIVGVSLALQIVFSLFSLFRFWGKVLLVLLIAAVAGGGFGLYQKVLEPYLAKEKQAISKPADEAKH